MANAAIYARFSCSKQREESIDDQVRVCRDAGCDGVCANIVPMGGGFGIRVAA